MILSVLLQAVWVGRWTNGLFCDVFCSRLWHCWLRKSHLRIGVIWRTTYINSKSLGKGDTCCNTLKYFFFYRESILTPARLLRMRLSLCQQVHVWTRVTKHLCLWYCKHVDKVTQSQQVSANCHYWKRSPRCWKHTDLSPMLGVSCTQFTARKCRRYMTLGWLSKLIAESLTIRKIRETAHT